MPSPSDTPDPKIRIFSDFQHLQLEIAFFVRPHCQAQLAREDIDSANACPEAWMHVTRQILGTCFQDVVI